MYNNNNFYVISDASTKLSANSEIHVENSVCKMLLSNNISDKQSVRCERRVESSQNAWETGKQHAMRRRLKLVAGASVAVAALKQRLLLQARHQSSHKFRLVSCEFDAGTQNTRMYYSIQCRKS